MKKGVLTLSVLAIAGYGAWYYLGEPEFYIENYDRLTKQGVFVFDGHKNSFGSGGGNASSRNNYSINYLTGSDGITTFELYKKGVFVREIKPYSIS